MVFQKSRTFRLDLDFGKFALSVIKSLLTVPNFEYHYVFHVCPTRKLQLASEFDAIYFRTQNPFSNHSTFVFQRRKYVVTFYYTKSTKMLNKKRPNWARLQDLCEDLKAKLSVKDVKKEDGTNTNLLMEKWKNASELRPFYIGKFY